jgi:hypothetical protein
MNSQKMVHAWHIAIIADAAQKLSRSLTEKERAIITKHAGFLALEALHDFILAAQTAEIVEFFHDEDDA